MSCSTAGVRGCAYYWQRLATVIFTQWHPDRKGETFQISRHLAIGRPHMVQTHWKCLLQSTKTSWIYIYRTFSPHCSPEFILHLYKSQVLPILEDGCVIWDPHFKKDKKLLESVHYFAIQIATKTWFSHNTIVSHMNYHLLNHGVNITNYFIPLNF